MLSGATRTRSPHLKPPVEEAARPARRRRGLSAAAWSVTVPIAVGALLGAIQLTARSLWLDEGASFAIASQHGSALGAAISHDGGNMLLYYLLLHVLIAAFGAGLVVLRGPSVIALAAVAGLTAGVALRLYGRPRVALSAGLLTAVSLPLVFWGQDARGYSLMLALSTGSYLAFLVVVRSPRRLPWLACLAYVLSTLLALYVGFYALLAVLAQVAVLPWFRDRARLIVGCLAIVAAACLPLLVLALDRGSGQLFWVPPLTWAILGKTGAILVSAGFAPNFHLKPLNFIAAGLTVLILVAVLARARRGPLGDRVLLVSWLVVPTVILLLAALFGEPVELARSIILVIPAVAILLAWGLHQERVPALAGWAGLAVILAVRALVLAPTYGASPENWKAAAAYVLRHSTPSACVAFYPLDGRMPFAYYLRGNPGARRLVPVYPDLPWSSVRPYVERYPVPSPGQLSAIAARCPSLWLLASHQGNREGAPAALRNLLRYQALLVALRHHYRHVHRSKFGYAAVIRVTQFRR